MTLLVLAGHHVHELLPYDECADVMRRALAELGELLTGTAPGRADDDEITVFESLGLAAEDLAAATYLYEKASRLGAGTAADF